MPTTTSSGGGSGGGSSAGGRGAAPARAPVPEAELASGAGAGSAASPDSAGASPAVETEAPMTQQEAEQAITANASGSSDIAGSLASEVLSARKTASQFASEYVGASLGRKAIEAYAKDASAGSNKARAQVLGARDPIAVQKFADIDGEAHLEAAHVGLKTTYYNDLIAKMRDPVYTDRSRTYEIMKGARGYSYTFKGKKLPAARLTSHSTRNQSVEAFYDKNKIPA